MRTLKYILSMGCSLVLATSVQAQSNITQFNFERVGNFHLDNPAAYQPYRLVVGFPGISNLTTSLHNPGFNFDPVLGPELTANQSVEYILNNLNPQDRMLVNQNLDIMYVGVRIKNGFLSMGVQAKTFVNFEYPTDILKLAYYGSESPEVGGAISMSDNQTQATSYLNFHLGYQHELLDGKLRVGGRFKWLQGLAHASATRSNLDATLGTSVWTFNTDIEANISTPLPLNNSSNVINPMDLLFGQNRGMAFDIGASYEVIPGLELSVAATDIGSITWRENTATYRSRGQYEWDGQDFAYGSEGGFDIDTIIGDIVDALEFTETTGEEFTSTLPTSYTINARYNLTPKHGFGLTFQQNEWNSRSYSNYGFSYIGNWSKWFSVYASYSLIEGDNTNIGVGFSANLGPIQLYLMTDDILLVSGENLNNVNLRFGMNVALYRRDLRGYDTTDETRDIVTPPIETVEPEEDNN